MAVDPSFIDQLQKLTLLSRRRVSSIYAGVRRSTQQGRGIEAVDYREYLPGDDPKTVDWKIYGRTEKLYIKRFEEEKNLLVHILLDASSSMNFSSSGMLKYDYAGSLAAGFAYMTIQGNDKFALSIFSEHLRDVMAAKKGKAHFFSAVDLMNAAKLSGESRLSQSMSEYAGLIKSKSFVVVFSDFLESIDSVREGVYRIAKNSKELMLVQVLDPWEVDLGWTDDVIFQDLETSATEQTFLSPNFKEKYGKMIAAHVQQLRKVAEDVGCQLYTITTNRPLLDSFMTLVNREVENATVV